MSFQKGGWDRYGKTGLIREGGSAGVCFKRNHSIHSLLMWFGERGTWFRLAVGEDSEVNAGGGKFVGKLVLCYL